MANYNLTQTFADGQTQTVTFTIPETAGTYQITATLTNTDGTTYIINAGTVIVEAKPNTYNVEFDMGNSTSLSTTITTPALGATMVVPPLQPGIDEIEYDYFNQDNVNQLIYAIYDEPMTIQVMPGTTVTYSIVTTSNNFIPYNTSDTASYDVGEDITSGTFPTVYAQYNGTPTITTTSATSNSVTATIKNNLSIAAQLSLWYATSADGSYSRVSYSSSAISAGSTTTITKSGLSPTTSYFFKVSYYDSTGNYKESVLSQYTHQNTTSTPTSFTVTIPEVKTGVKSVTYNYTNTSGTQSAVTAESSLKSITVKANTVVKRTALTVSDSKYYQDWSGNAMSWTITSNTTLPAQYAQFKGTPTITSSASAQTWADVYGKNTLGMAVQLALFRSSNPTGTYTQVGYTSSSVANNSTGKVTDTGLTPGSTYYYKMAYYSSAGNVKTGAQSSYTTVYTDPEETT